jgi:hypothetical protein
VKPGVVYGSEYTGFDCDGYEKTEYMGDENKKKDTWISGRAKKKKKKD